MSKKILLAGVSALTLAFAATAAHANYDNNDATTLNGNASIDQQVNTGTAQVNGNVTLDNLANESQTLNGSQNETTDNSNQGNNNTNNTKVGANESENLGNTGQIAGGTNNNASGNKTLTNTTSTVGVKEANGNGSNNETSENSIEIKGSLAIETNNAVNNLVDNSVNHTNSASFDETDTVNVNVLGANVVENVMNYQPATGNVVQGNSLQESANSFDGVSAFNMNAGAGAASNLAVSVHVGTASF